MVSQPAHNAADNMIYLEPRMRATVGSKSCLVRDTEIMVKSNLGASLSHCKMVLKSGAGEAGSD